MKKGRSRIDKSQLAFGEPERKRDDKYLRSFKDRTCMASRNGIDLCGLPAVAAHCRVGQSGGMALKPGDDEVLALCPDCHREQHNFPEAEWLVEYVLKPQMRREYRKWLRIS